MRRPGSNKVVETFAEASAPEIRVRPATRKSGTKPFSIRLTDAERARLEREAGSRPLGAYMRSKLLAPDKRSIAQVLAALGSSELATSMRDIAAAARNGALEETPDILLTLQAACLSIETMRSNLMRALGLRAKDRP